MTHQSVTIQRLLDSTTARLDHIKATLSGDVTAIHPIDHISTQTWNSLASEAKALSQAVVRLQTALQSTPQPVPLNASKMVTSNAGSGRKQTEGDHTLLKVPKKRKSYHQETHDFTQQFSEQQGLCNSEVSEPDSPANPDCQAASTPLAIAALAAMGMARANTSRVGSRSEQETSQDSMQLLLQAAETTDSEQPASSNSAATCKGGGKALRKCTCKKSKCLKLYCECFAAGVFCDNCQCTNCCNTVENVQLIGESKKNIIKARPAAFEPKVIDSAQQHSKGCNCRKSRCVKKYCECFQNGVQCTEACRCLDCHNYGPKDRDAQAQPDSVSLRDPPHSQQAAGQEEGMGLAKGSSMQHSVSAMPAASSSMVLQTALSSSSAVLTAGCANASATESRHPQQMTGCTVTLSKFSSQGVQPLPAGSSGLLPLGTIIMPANESLPPGSLVLPQGNCPGGQLRLALPGQLPALGHIHLYTSAAASVDGASEALRTQPTLRGQEGVNNLVSSRLGESNVCAVASDAAAAAPSQSVQQVSQSQYLQSSTEVAHTAAVLHVRGQQGLACSMAAEPQSTDGDDLERDAVSVTASEGTSMLDDATSPPPMGLTGFARRASREPFAALQLHAKRPQAAAYLQACEEGSQGSQGSAGVQKGISSSLLTSGCRPLATTKQARSKKQRGSRLAPNHLPPAGKAGKAGKGNSRAGRSSAMTHTGSSALSNCRRAGMSGVQGLWDSPPTKSSRPLQQNVWVPGQSMRSGRISKLTERFSEYKSQTLDAKINAADQRLECDPELVDVVAALCDLGQQSSMLT